MAIEAKKIDREPMPPVSEYPCLKISTDSKCIVLFSSRNSGVVVHSDDDFSPVGMYHRAWIDDCFTPYTGTIELRNV